MTVMQDELCGIKSRLDKFEKRQDDLDKDCGKQEVVLAVLREQMASLILSVNQLNQYFSVDGLGSRLAKIETNQANTAQLLRHYQEYERSRWRFFWRVAVGFLSGAALVLLAWWLERKLTGD